MRIAIIDEKNQDIGLKILFPEADYYIGRVEYNSKINNMKKFDIVPILDWSNINSTNYDYLIIIMCCIEAVKEDTEHGKAYYNKILPIIEQNNFTKVAIFDNHDYMYDPNEYIKCEKVDYFFKRHYNKMHNYKENVISFPFFCFGYEAMIEKIVNNEQLEYNKMRHNIIFFSGTIFEHIDKEHNVNINRIKIYNEIKKYLYNPGIVDNNIFMKYLQQSKYALDLLGIGEPNIRTIEILVSGALLISQKPNNIKWPFPEEFSKETKFLNGDDFFKIIVELDSNPELYQHCIDNQNYIVKKYFNKKWLSDYVINHLIK
jgi:hypothetical protein